MLWQRIPFSTPRLECTSFAPALSPVNNNSARGSARPGFIENPLYWRRRVHPLMLQQAPAGTGGANTPRKVQQVAQMMITCSRTSGTEYRVLLGTPCLEKIRGRASGGGAFRQYGEPYKYSTLPLFSLSLTRPTHFTISIVLRSFINAHFLLRDHRSRRRPLSRSKRGRRTSTQPCTSVCPAADWLSNSPRAH